MSLFAKFRHLGCLLAIVSLNAIASPKPDDRQKLIELFAQQNYSAAYQLAETLFDLLAGDPDFDYLYGLSAYQAGDTQAAIFAFERALLVRPEDEHIRYALALAYLKVKNYRAARHEFAYLNSASDFKVRQASRQYLNRIKQAEWDYSEQWQAYLGVALGYDSNIYSTLEDKLYPLPQAYYLPTEGEQADQAAYLNRLSADFQYFKPVTKNGRLIADAAVAKTAYSGNNRLQHTRLDLALGYRHQWQAYSASTQFGYQTFWLGGGAYQNLYALSGEADWHYQPGFKLAVKAKFGLSDNLDNDALDLQTNSLKLSHSYQNKQYQLITYIAHAKESVQEPSIHSKHFERRVNELGINWQMQLTERGQIQVSYRYQTSRHPYPNETIRLAGSNARGFEDKRKDNLNVLSLGFVYAVSEQWVWQTTYQLRQRSSNQFIYDIDGNQLISQLSYKL